MQDNIISIDEEKANNNLIFDNNPELKPTNENEIITELPSWSIEPPVVINRGSDEL